MQRSSFLLLALAAALLFVVANADALSTAHSAQGSIVVAEPFSRKLLRRGRTSYKNTEDEEEEGGKPDKTFEKPEKKTFEKPEKRTIEKPERPTKTKPEFTKPEKTIKEKPTKEFTPKEKTPKEFTPKEKPTFEKRKKPVEEEEEGGRR